MRVNEHSAVSTSKVLLVPYDRRHVPRYHEWMKDPEIQEATASEPLTLEEEFENQESWRSSHDKLTFIVCHPVAQEDPRQTIVQAGAVDSPDQMIGDINFFLYHWDDDELEDAERSISDADALPRFCIGEIDIMIASPQDRGKGIGRAAVTAFLCYIQRNLAAILQEYGSDKGYDTTPQRQPELKQFMVKIKQGNVGSIALFAGLNFEKEGDVNYFGEIKMVLGDINKIAQDTPGDYMEVAYSRPDQQ